MCVNLVVLNIWIMKEFCGFHKMKCKICDTEMDIDGWGGLWMCFNCGFVGDKATSREIENGK